MRCALDSAVFSASSAAFCVFLQDQHAVVRFLRSREIKSCLACSVSKSAAVTRRFRTALVKQGLSRIETASTAHRTLFESCPAGLECLGCSSCKIRRRKLPLRQLGPKHIHRVISACEVLVKVESRIPMRTALVSALLALPRLRRRSFETPDSVAAPYAPPALT